MADDKSKTKQDRNRIAAGEPYEVDYFKRKHSLTTDEAKQIIKEAKGDRSKADELASKLKSK